jgi:ABC-type branched-subunit amino acid transport system ATPase component/predicted MFS family arabinose efflux permease
VIPSPAPLLDVRALDVGASSRATGPSRAAVVLAVLTAIGLMDYLDSAALAALAPDIQRSLHLSDAGFAGVVTLQVGVFVVAAVPIGLLADRLPRFRVAGLAALVASVATLLTGLVQSTGQLVVARVLNESGQAAILPVHPTIVAEQTPEDRRSRALGVLSAGAPIGTLVGPFLGGGLAALLGGGSAWRTVFLLLAVPSVALSLALLLLRGPAQTRPAEPVTASQGVTRLLAIPSFRALCIAVAVLGTELVAVPVYFALLLDRRYGLSVAERGAAISATEAGALAGVLLGGVLADRVRARGPGRVVTLLAGGTISFGVLFPLSLYLPGLLPVLAGVAVARAAAGLATVPSYALVVELAPQRLRALAFAVLGVSIFLGGGLAGTLLVGGVSDAQGPAVALAAVTGPAAVLAGLLALRMRPTLEEDLAAALIADLTEPEQRDGTAPALEVRALEAGYGPLQVLFGIDLTVRAGEVLALLGTNGAGKSTLLRAISGTLTPRRGSVLLSGQAVTFADAPARVRAGLVQVPGGRAVFPSMTVRENLLVGGMTLSRDVPTLRLRIDEVLTLLPILRDRLEQPAGLLSGGEQQMLAIGKALLLKPQVLLIDELSLGLAPLVVQELLQVVRGLAATGTAVVLVEQSINVALTVADRAIFLEKGVVAFEGAAADLLERDDLARAVFLGAARA